MVSMTLTGTTELMDALDEVPGHRPGTVFWVNAAQRVFEALAAATVAASAPLAARSCDESKAICEAPSGLLRETPAGLRLGWDRFNGPTTLRGRTSRRRFLILSSLVGLT